MQIGWLGIYCIIFLQTLVLSLLLTPLSARLGKKIGLIDPPSVSKIHTVPKPRSGGIAIFCSFTLVLITDVLLAVFFKGFPVISKNVSPYLANIHSILPQLGALFAGAFIIFVTGVIDDRWTLRPFQKLFLQIIAIIPLLLTGIRIVMFLPPVFGILLTVGWLILIINAFNFIDNMDGLSSGVAIIVLFFLAYLSYQSGEYFMVALYIALAGVALGFWRYNFFSSSLFMGDCGSMFLGYMIGSLTVLSTYYQSGLMPTKLPVLIPVIVLGVPIFDTISVVLIRIKNRRPIMVGDTNHFSHRLVNLGLTQRQAVVFIYLITICVALNALPLRYLDTTGSVLQFFQTVLLFLVIFLLEQAGKRS